MLLRISSERLGIGAGPNDGDCTDNEDGSEDGTCCCCCCCCASGAEACAEDCAEDCTDIDDCTDSEDGTCCLIGHPSRKCPYW